MTGGVHLSLKERATGEKNRGRGGRAWACSGAGEQRHKRAGRWAKWDSGVPGRWEVAARRGQWRSHEHDAAMGDALGGSSDRRGSQDGGGGGEDGGGGGRAPRW